MNPLLLIPAAMAVTLVIIVAWRAFCAPGDRARMREGFAREHAARAAETPARKADAHA